MRVLPWLAVAIVLVETVAAVFFATQGSWLLAGLLLAGVVAGLLVVRALARRSVAPPTGGYVERESHYW